MTASRDAGGRTVEGAAGLAKLSAAEIERDGFGILTSLFTLSIDVEARSNDFVFWKFFFIGSLNLA
jgi:hypothetical protein